ncbi:MAG: hypothetical protein HC881_21535 [Leptolyngbyaceae cyanobacterium SL_7_1]|nr:hypothetical protein [Leptolyngbyaceae cyanobacterium SL_7_1]
MITAAAITAAISTTAIPATIPTAPTGRDRSGRKNLGCNEFFYHLYRGGLAGNIFQE